MRITRVMAAQMAGKPRATQYPCAPPVGSGLPLPPVGMGTKFSATVVNDEAMTTTPLEGANRPYTSSPRQYH